MAIGIFSSGLLGFIGLIPVDVKLGEYHGKSATVTNYAVESGANRSDHIILNPETIEIHFEINNQDFSGVSYGLRAATVAQLARRLMNSRQLSTIVTRHHLYTDMALVDFPHENIAPISGKLTGKLTFQKFNEPTLELVDTPESQLTDNVAKTGSGTVDGGQQVGAPPASGLRSLLSQIFG